MHLFVFMLNEFYMFHVAGTLTPILTPSHSQSCPLPVTDAFQSRYPNLSAAMTQEKAGIQRAGDTAHTETHHRKNRYRGQLHGPTVGSINHGNPSNMGSINYWFHELWVSINYWIYHLWGFINWVSSTMGSISYGFHHL